MNVIYNVSAHFYRSHGHLLHSSHNQSRVLIGNADTVDRLTLNW